MTTTVAGWPRRLLAGVRGWALWELPRWLAWFVITVMAVDAAAIGVAADSARLRAGQAGLFALLLGLSVATVELTRRAGEPAGVIKDVHGAWELTIAVFLPPVCALLAPIPRLAITQWRTRRTLAYRRMFTAAATGLSYGSASIAYHAMASRAVWLSPGPGTSRWLAWIAVVAVCGLVQQAINLTLVVTAVKGSDPGASVRELAFARESLFNDGAELVTTVVTAVLTAVGALLAVLALPLMILLHRSHRHAQLVAAARVDAKTGLLNAVAWQREAMVELARASRTRTPAAVAMVDIDHFKAINDRHGHLTGDAVLAALAAAMRSLLRDYDLIGRFGGEEFSLLLPHTTAAEATQAAQRLRSRIARLTIPAVTPDSEPVRVTVSIGVATVQSSRRDLDELLAAADAALYRAKAAGRNQVVVSGESDHAMIASRPGCRGEENTCARSAPAS
jgi:diguanylate cyclase (GGDEF)-like protein